METTSYLVSLEGVVERITYSNDENGYTIARLQPAEGRELATIAGNLPSLNVGESLRLEGRWTNHPRFGRQFQVERYQVVLPATAEGIRRYLGSGLIKGIGPVTAGRIVDHFGMETLDVIEQEPKRLREVSGLGYKRADMITQAWEAQKTIKEVMLFLQSLQISSSLAVRIYKQYGDSSPAIVQKEPYRMAREVFGIGGGYQLLGKYFRTHTGETLEGIGVFDASTVAGDKRCIGNVIVECSFTDAPRTLVGFENHSGKAYLGPGCRPMSKSLTGLGNNGEDRFEGAIYRNAFGCYLHGSL